MIIGRVFFLFLSIFACDLLFSQTIPQNKEKADLFHQQALEKHEHGRDSDAYVLTLKSISILDSLGNNNIPLYAECKHDAGMFALLGLRDTTAFISNISDAISLKKELYGNSDDYYWSIECYANGLLYISDIVGFPKNIELLERSIQIFGRIPNIGLIDSYRRAINNLAYFYENVDIERSIFLSEQLLDVERNYNVGDTLVTISNLAKYYTDIDNAKALSYAKEVLDVRNRLHPNDLDKIRVSYLRIASICGHNKDFSDAICYSLKALSIADSLYGSSSMEYALSSQNTGVYYMMNRDTINSLKYIKQAYLCPKGDKMGNAINLAGIYSSINEVDSCFKYLNEGWSIFRLQYVRDLEAMSNRNRFNYACIDLNYGIMTSPINYYSQHKEDKRLSKLAFDCILFSKGVGIDCMNNEKLNHTITLNFDSIKSYLREGEVAIEIWADKSKILEKEDDLWVSIVRKDSDSPVFFTLSKDKISKTLRNEYNTTATFLPLYEYIWKDIIEIAKLKDGERLYISLDDFLCNIPIESICDYNWQYMGDKYDIVFVSTTCEIPNIRKKKGGNSASLFGGLKYENKNAVSESKNRNIIIDDYMQNEIGDTIISYLRSNTKYLPWTKMEVDSIKDILLHNTRHFDVMMFQGEKGTEETFKSFSGSSASIIHIATHGFNIHPPRGNMRWYDYYVYCMEHTGLLLSGALYNSDNKDVLGTEDGFLRSSEISTLDLSKTDLLVLSACKSGLSGQTPIGNAGLLRAFKAAGVGTILMTLDDVDDAATCQLMVDFYRYLSNGYTKREAFKKARQELRKSELFKNFNYWGYFVLID